MTDKIGSFIIDIAGTELCPEDRDLLAHPLVGGVVLFARNYKARKQIIELCASIRKTRDAKLLIMVDQEGGRVQRFIDEFTRLPHMATIGRFFDQNPVEACKLARECAWLMATELLAVGVDLSFAPVLDLHKELNKAIGDRAFHADPQAIIQLATAFVAGMREAGMAATGKHFPGHGSVSVDSHVAIPQDNRHLNAIEQTDMVPFAAMIKAGISAIMAAHIVYPNIDKLPVGFSSIWLKEILREKLGFKGVIVSDDLNMEGANISTNYADRVQAARDAGCDFALLCNNRPGVIQVLDQMCYEKHLVEKAKWVILAANLEGANDHFVKQPRWQAISHQLKTLGKENVNEQNTGT